ncbi:MAG: ATP-dependent 6-phosphofructokinase [Candidatus Hydrogenedentes bacterium]|nr:ATP-dependent 6-phosphofructokinase [Candidatus Hydrogenedentota bacterium]
MTVTSLGECPYDSPLTHYVSDEVLVPAGIEWTRGQVPLDLQLFEKAGPRAKLYFDPKQVRAGIVTCGGLCPGLNNVIRSLVYGLHHQYGVKEVLGFRDGYRGLDPQRGEEPIPLTLDLVDDIHEEGGTILGTSRGPVDTKTAVDNLIRLEIDALFTVGGDGTQRGAKSLYEEAMRREYPLAVVGVPKTIDNDVHFVARTFGFSTAVEAAREVIANAHTEAHSVHNGVSVVKLMGRHAGFIAATATVASQDVNFCLIPESPFVLNGDGGFLAALQRRLVARRHAVIVVAEGAGQDLIPGETGAVDASGNAKLEDIGKFLCDEITKCFKAQELEVVVRYFDPSYQIRSRPANSDDAVLCDRFARGAVHAAMAGKTGMIVGLLHGELVHVPIGLPVQSRKEVKMDGDLWHGVLACTGQPAQFA